MRRLVVIATLVALAGLALSGCGPSQAPNPSTSRFAKGTCLFVPGAGVTEGTNLTCGTLSVPEDRQHPATSRQIKLAVAVFAAPDPSTAGDPVVYLGGGPGGDVIKALGHGTVPGWVLHEFGNRELIYIDQRGTGFSDPSLRCPEWSAAALTVFTQDPTAEQVTAIQQQALQTCSSRLTRDGVNLAAYTTAQNAADVHDLLAALDIKRASLWGGSYGTRLALEVMRTYPEGIESVVLDSAYPPQENMFVTAAVYRARDLLHVAELCAADVVCRQLHPDIAGRFISDVHALEAHPVQFTFYSLSDHQEHPIQLTGSLFESLVGVALYSTEGIAQVPEMIDNVATGDVSRAESWFKVMMGQYDTMAEGMFLSVECAEDAPFATSEAITEQVNTLPASIRPLIAPAAAALRAECTLWPVPSAPASVKSAVTSAIPTLIFEGGLDPTTPSLDGALAAKSLTHGYEAYFAYEAHGVQWPNDCAGTIARAFLDHPQSKPDMSCIGLQVPLRFT
jgi:pimeloyl-ACP methyl ester carboxylesterase